MSTVLKYHLDPAAWVLPSKINAMKNCAYCNQGLTPLSGEVNARFIVLLRLFDRTQAKETSKGCANIFGTPFRSEKYTK